MMYKRSQAAMEFLMTYGWAILAVLIVIGALAFFGVTNPLNLLPDKCTTQLPFECKDYQIIYAQPVGKIALQINNAGGKDINISKTIWSSQEALVNQCIKTWGSGGVDTGVIVLNGDYLEIVNNTCAVASATRAKDRFKVIIQYNYVGSPFFHNATGEILTKIQG